MNFPHIPLQADLISDAEEKLKEREVGCAVVCTMSLSIPHTLFLLTLSPPHTLPPHTLIHLPPHTLPTLPPHTLPLHTLIHLPPPTFSPHTLPPPTLSPPPPHTHTHTQQELSEHQSAELQKLTRSLHAEAESRLSELRVTLEKEMKEKEEEMKLENEVER